MSIPAAVVCEPQVPPCCEGALVFYGQGKTYLSAQTGFLLTCPPGFSCDAGAYPHPIVVPKGTIPFTPPTGSNPLRITCCDGVVLASYLPDGFTQAQFDTAAQSLVDEAAQHLAQCMAADYNAAHSKKRLIFDNPKLNPVCANTDYSEQIEMSGGIPPYAFTLTGGTLPPNVTLSPTGLLEKISGGSTVGTYVFQVQVTDASTGIGIKTFSLHVVAIDVSMILPMSPRVPYSSPLVSLGTTGQDTWSIVAGSLPEGLSLNSATGVISGTPTDNDVVSFTFTAQVTDEDDPPCLCAAEATITWFCDPDLSSAVSQVIDLTWGNAGNGTASIMAGNGTFSYAGADGLIGPRMLSDNLCTDFTYPLVVSIDFNASGIRAPSTFDLQWDLRFNGVIVDTVQVGGGGAGAWALNGNVQLTWPLPVQSLTQIRIDLTFQGLTTSVTGTYQVRPLIRP